jgi:hypothetical protein
MKAVKLAGIRLVNYIIDGINWKDHRDIVLDFWVSYKCREFGYVPKQFFNMFTVEELPTEAQGQYEQWFNGYNFQSTDDKDWIDFVNGTLNVFYHTKDPIMLGEDEWYVDLMKSEIEAREIAEAQLYHGNPNINSFWKLDTNSKPEEVRFWISNKYIKPTDVKMYGNNHYIFEVEFKGKKEYVVGYFSSGLLQGVKIYSNLNSAKAYVFNYKTSQDLHSDGFVTHDNDAFARFKNFSSSKNENGVWSHSPGNLALPVDTNNSDNFKIYYKSNILLNRTISSGWYLLFEYSPLYSGDGDERKVYILRKALNGNNNQYYFISFDKEELVKKIK